MRDTLLLAAAFTMTYLAFASFALMQRRHWQVVTSTNGCPSSGKRVLRFGGMACIIGGCAIIFWREGLGYGSLLWVTQLIVAACGVVATLALRPRLLKWLTTLPKLGRW